jgi:hypothetical protein
MATPMFQTKIQKDAVVFEIYAYRKLTTIEIDREIAFYIIDHKPLRRGKTYRVFSSLGEPGETAN